MHALKSRSFPPSLYGLLTIALLSSLVYLPLLNRPLFLSEYPFFYFDNAEMTWGDWIRSYWPGNGGWYRPTAFYTYFQVLTHWVSWHDFLTIRIIAIGHMIVLGWAVMKLGLTLWPQRPRIAVVAGVIAAIHPIQAMQVVDLIHFDTIYQTALVLLAVWFLSPERETRLGRIGSFLLALLFWFIALTSKEPSVAMPGWLAILGLLVAWSRKDGDRALMLSRGKWIMAGFVTLTAVILLGFRLSQVNMGAEGAYRVAPDVSQILANAVAGSLWLLHLFVVDSPSWAGYSANLNGWASTVFGVLFVALLGVALWSLRRSARSDRLRILIPLAWAAVFFLIPVYSGGRPWHFGPSLVGIALLAGYGLDRLIGSIGSVRYQQWILGALAVAFAGISAQNMLDDRQFRHNPQEWVLAALQAPPVKPAHLHPDATIVYEVGEEAEKWALGMGHLWSFVYLRPDLKELPIPHLEDLTTQQVEHLMGREHLHFFVLETNPEPSWRDRPERLQQWLNDYVEQSRRKSIHIDFSLPSPALVATEGLGGPESWGRWNDGPTTRLRLRTPQGLAMAGNWHFTIAGSPYIPAEREPFTITIEVNGREVFSRRVQHPQDATLLRFDWNRKRPIRGDDEQFELTLHYSNLTSPKELSLSGDGRPLAFGLRTLDVRPAEE